MPIKRPTIPRVPLDGARTDLPPKEILNRLGLPELEAETPLLAEETDAAALIAADAEISIPLLFGAIILLGLLYTAKYTIVPLLKMAQVPGSGWLSDAVNGILSIITSPIKSAFQWVMHEIALGIEAHAEPITRAMESAAWVVHDTAVELANLAASITVATAEIVTVVIPREITKQTAPLKLRIGRVEFFNAKLNATAKRNGFADYPTAAKVQVPQTLELGRAETYVHGQGHKSLTGALSAYQTTTNQVKTYEETVRKLHYYTLPTWITHITTEITKVVPQTIKKLTLRVGKIELRLKPDKTGMIPILAAMPAAAIGTFFLRALPRVCPAISECVANNLLGSNIWKYFKDLLGLLLALDIGLFALADLCAISKLADDVVAEIEPAIRSLVVVSDGLASIGCASPGPVLSAPLY